MLTGQDLKNYKLFAGLDDNELEGIAQLCTRRTYESNTTIFNLDNPTDEVFILEGGNESVQIEVPISDRGDKIVIHTLGRGETFGWAALGSQHIHTAIARCLERTSVIAINGKNLMLWLDKHNRAGYIVMRNLADIISTRLAYTTIALRHELRKARREFRVGSAL